MSLLCWVDGSGLAVTSFSHSRPSLLQLGFRFRRLALFRPGLGLALGWAYPSKELVLPRRVVYRVSEWVSEVVPPRRRRSASRVSAARRPYHPRASARPRRWAPASTSWTRRWALAVCRLTGGSGAATCRSQEVPREWTRQLRWVWNSLRSLVLASPTIDNMNSWISIPAGRGDHFFILAGLLAGGLIGSADGVVSLEGWWAACIVAALR